MSKLEKYVNQAISDFDTIKEAIKRKGIEVPYGTDTREYGALIDAIESMPASIILRDENGAEAVATLVETATVFTATENDIREGTVAATEKGVTVGTKVIPSYHTTEGQRFIKSGERYIIPFGDELYDFNKFQAIICPYNKSIEKSVAADKVVINNGVYPVNSADLLATVTKDSESKTIDLGITNDSENLYVLRFITYKEIE